MEQGRKQETEAGELLREVKAYLLYLKGMGVRFLPQPMKAQGPLTPDQLSRLTLRQVRVEMGNCKRCKLHRTRKALVFGEGNEKATLMLVGEGPGNDEDVQGRPFVGQAGQLLTRILQAIQLERNQVYITNVVKCRPPENRKPEPEEEAACLPFLLKQIRVVAPRIICALGAVAAQALLQTAKTITALRGRIFELPTIHGIEVIRVIPTYHPAFLLRNPERKREVWEDMKRIADLLRNTQ